MTAEEKQDELVVIDQGRLDKEWLDQPRKYLKYATRLAAAKLAVNEAKAELELTVAEISLDIRRSPGAYDLSKITEDMVEKTVLTQDRYKMALRLYNDARHKQDALTAVVDALDHRKSALEKLVALHGQGYFAEPRAETPAAKAATEEYTKKAVRGKSK